MKSFQKLEGKSGVLYTSLTCACTFLHPLPPSPSSPLATSHTYLLEPITAQEVQYTIINLYYVIIILF